MSLSGKRAFWAEGRKNPKGLRRVVCLHSAWLGQGGQGRAPWTCASVCDGSEDGVLVDHGKDPGFHSEGDGSHWRALSWGVTSDLGSARITLDSSFAHSRAESFVSLVDGILWLQSMKGKTFWKIDDAEKILHELLSRAVIDQIPALRKKKEEIEKYKATLSAPY